VLASLKIFANVLGFEPSMLLVGEGLLRAERGAFRVELCLGELSERA
jgi:hypothetical protein